MRVKKEIRVVGAVIVRDGLVLCTKRGTGPLAGLWEFPGGKVEDGESLPDALQREIREELLCEIAVGEEVTTTIHEDTFRIVHLTTFYSEIVGGEPQLTEHAESRWLAPEHLGSLDWAPADVLAVRAVGTKAARANVTPGP